MSEATNVARELGAIAAELKSVNDRLDSHSERSRETIALLRGDGERPGVMTRLDRLEQLEQRRARWIAILGTATVGLLIDAIGKVLRGPP